MSTTPKILQMINEMGYVTCIPVDVKPSVYRTLDGNDALIMLHVDVDYLMPNPATKNNFGLSMSSRTNVMVPDSKRKPQNFKLFEQSDLASKVIDDDVKYETLDERFSTYKLGNGSTLGIKIILAQIQKTSLYQPGGEPLYSISSTVATKLIKGKA